jgi:rod shape determining protein RodA
MGRSCQQLRAGRAWGPPPVTALRCRRHCADNRRMSAVFEKPPLLQRLAPMLQGFDGPLAFAVFLLACAGLLTMYSSGYDHGTRFMDHGRNMLLAGFIMFVVAQVPPQRLMAFAVPLYALGVALLIAVAVFGIAKKGARRWVNVGIVIQPSEILKIAMPLMLAWWFQKREGQLRPLDFFVAIVLLAIPVGLIMKQPDLGTSLLVLAAGLSVIFFAGLSWKLIVPPVVLGLVALALLVIFESDLCAQGFRWPILHDYQQQRICTLLDPTKDPLGKGFHIIQGMIAIGSGGIFGKGFMQGTQTHLEFIPERTTDFIFAAFSEEFGLLGNLCLIGAFLFLIFRGLSIALEASTLFSRLLAGAVTMIFFTYAFVNMGMVSGILPVVGVPLPFISYGGTAMVTLGMGLGILMSIAKAKRLVQS